MISLTEEQFDCLDAIADGGFLCEALDDRKLFTGRYVARASSKVNPFHPGWETSVVGSLIGAKLITSTDDGEYIVTLRGKKSHMEFRVARQMEAVRVMAEANPDKIVLMSAFRKGASR